MTERQHDKQRQDMYEIARYTEIPAERIDRFMGALAGCGYKIVRASAVSATATPAGLMRYCRACGSKGDVAAGYRNCCPDGYAEMLHPETASQARLGFLARLERSTPPSTERTDAALHACEGLDTVDLAGNKRGWLAEVVHDAARVERNLHSALRARCPGNGDEPLDGCCECQSYEAHEQAQPCPPGCCVMADEKDIRSIVAALEADEDGAPAPETASSAVWTPAIYYQRAPEYDRRIANGDDFSGDAFVRWVAVGHEPSDARKVEPAPPAEVGAPGDPK